MEHRIKIAHEAPRGIFKQVQDLTDYDYALVHLFEEDEEYYKLFENALAKGREVILDNSIFELGEAFNMDKFASWIKKLKPTYYIVPDSLENCHQTILNMETWNEKYRKDIPGKVIGVVQGFTYEDMVACYRYMVSKAKVDRVAISFDMSLYEDEFPHENKLFSWCFGRISVLNRMLRDGIIDTTKEHHLLGCSLPGEGMFYPKSWTWITSTDTSNPVLHGCEGIEYRGMFGLTQKSSTKMFTIMQREDFDRETVMKVANNILMFNHFWNNPAFKFNN